MADDEQISGRWRVSILAVTLLLVLALVADVLAPVSVAAEGKRDRERGAPRTEQEWLERTVPPPAGRAERGAGVEVVGGTPVSQGTFDFMVLVLVDQGGGFVLCGGSLVSASFVLTAAHCVEDEFGVLFPAENYRLSIGQVDISTFDPEDGRRVSEVVQHPNWNPITFANDVAVLELTQPVPANVATPLRFVGSGQTNLDEPGQPVTVAGWGTTSSGGVISDDLLKADVTVVSDSACAADYAANGGITEDVMICAAFAGRDSCQGDSGGPLFARDVVGHKFKKKKRKKGKKRKKKRVPIVAEVQMGIVSFGIGCADPEFPGVYTQVSAPGINDFIVAVVD